MPEEEVTNKSFALVKPDALTPFKYQQVDALIKLNEFEITRQKLVWLTSELADALFPDKVFDEDHQEWIDYITCAPSLALELTKDDATLYWQITMGPEFSAESEDRDNDSIRGILAIDRIRNAVDGSEEPENAVKQLALVFSDSVPEIPYDSFLMQRAESAHQTLAMIKPDVSQDEHAVAKVMNRITARGYTIKDRIDIKLSKAQARTFYAEHAEKPFFEGLVSFMTSGPVIALLLDGDDVIRGWRTMIGPTNSGAAREQAPLSLRAQIGADGQRNAVHGSDSAESAQRELSFFFFPRIQPEEDVSDVEDELEDNEAGASTLQSQAAEDSKDTNTAAGTAPGTAAEAAAPVDAGDEKKKKKKKPKRRNKRKQAVTVNSSGNPPAAASATAAAGATAAQATVSDESDEEPTSPAKDTADQPAEKKSGSEQAAAVEPVSSDAKEAPEGTTNGAESQTRQETEIDGAAAASTPEAPLPIADDSVVELARPSDPAYERTFALIKPDAYPRYRKQLVKHIVEKGFTVVSQEEVVLTAAAAERIYSEMRTFPVFSRLIDFVTSGPSLALVLEGANAVSAWKELVGPTNPKTAKFESRDSLRARYGQDAQQNAVHASKDASEAARSIEAVFYGLLNGNFKVLGPGDDPLAVSLPAEAAKHEEPTADDTPDAVADATEAQIQTGPEAAATAEPVADAATEPEAKADEHVAEDGHAQEQVPEPIAVDNDSVDDASALAAVPEETTEAVDKHDDEPVEDMDVTEDADAQNEVANVADDAHLADKLSALAVSAPEPAADGAAAEPNGVRYDEVPAEPAAALSVNGGERQQAAEDAGASETPAPTPATPPQAKSSAPEKPSPFGKRLASSPFLQADRLSSHQDPLATAKRVGRVKSPFIGSDSHADGTPAADPALADADSHDKDLKAIPEDDDSLPQKMADLQIEPDQRDSEKEKDEENEPAGQCNVESASETPVETAALTKKAETTPAKAAPAAATPKTDAARRTVRATHPATPSAAARPSAAPRTPQTRSSTRAAPPSAATQRVVRKAPASGSSAQAPSATTAPSRRTTSSHAAATTPRTRASQASGGASAAAAPSTPGMVTRSAARAAGLTPSGARTTLASSTRTPPSTTATAASSVRRSTATAARASAAATTPSRTARLPATPTKAPITAARTRAAAASSSATGAARAATATTATTAARTRAAAASTTAGAASATTTRRTTIGAARSSAATSSSASPSGTARRVSVHAEAASASQTNGTRTAARRSTTATTASPRPVTRSMASTTAGATASATAAATTTRTRAAAGPTTRPTTTATSRTAATTRAPAVTTRLSARPAATRTTTGATTATGTRASAARVSNATTKPAVPTRTARPTAPTASAAPATHARTGAKPAASATAHKTAPAAPAADAHEPKPVDTNDGRHAQSSEAQSRDAAPQEAAAPAEDD